MIRVRDFFFLSKMLFYCGLMIHQEENTRCNKVLNPAIVYGAKI